MIRIFVTGGTFDKTYDEIRGQSLFGDTHVTEICSTSACVWLPVSVRTLMMVDSLEMTDSTDRQAIVTNLPQSATKPASSSRTARTRWWRRRRRWWVASRARRSS